MSAQIFVDVQSDAATVTLSNPGKLNALCVSMWRDLATEFAALNQNMQLRHVVIRGEGTEAFAAGADISEFDEVRNTREQVEHYHETRVREALCAIRDCPVPVVAAIHGACVGGGLEIAAMCDLRICSEDARFGIPVSRLGFPMAFSEMELVWNAVSPNVLTELLLEARLMNAQEALGKGLVNRVVAAGEFDSAIAATVARIAAGAPLVNRAHKRQLQRLRENREPLTRDERLSSYFFLDTEDYRIGRRAFADKTTPRFEGR